MNKSLTAACIPFNASYICTMNTNTVKTYQYTENKLSHKQHLTTFSQFMQCVQMAEFVTWSKRCTNVV